MDTKNRSSGDASPVRQLFQLCTRCGQPILSEGSNYKYEKDAGCHWACLRKETRQDLVTSLIHELWLLAFSVLYSGYNEKRLVLNLFEGYKSNSSVSEYLACIAEAVRLAKACPVGDGEMLVNWLSEIKLDAEALMASLKGT